MASTTLRTGDQTVGSVWNKNSWHWEEKDYNKAAQAKLKEVLETLTLDTGNNDPIRFTSVVPSGFASISVRKGKKVVVFEFAISMLFECVSAKGSLKIPEFSNDELEPVVRVELGSGDESVKEFLRKDGLKAIRSSLTQFVDFMNSVETGDAMLESDKVRREQEMHTAAVATAAKGEEKQRIAEEVKARESQQIANKNLVESSVWNVNSYHWETKKLDKWAHEEVRSLLEKHSGFSNIQVAGEAENSIRKGRIISIFNLRISGDFKSVSFSIPHFSNEEGDDDCESPKIVCEDKSIKDAISQLIPLKGFLNELKAQ